MKKRFAKWCVYDKLGNQVEFYGWKLRGHAEGHAKRIGGYVRMVKC